MQPWVLRAFWRAYQRGGDGKWSMSELYRAARDGHIYCAWVLEQNQEDGDYDVQAQFGIELMHDEEGLPYTHFLFFDRNPAIAGKPSLAKLRDMAPTVCFTAWQLAMHYRDAEGFNDNVRVRLKGRPGWRRVVERMGLVMDANGWISDNQEFFHGNVGRTI
jgi:hypothetical protein